MKQNLLNASICRLSTFGGQAELPAFSHLMDQRTQTAPRTGLPWACLRSDLQQTRVSGPITTHFGIGKYENADLGIRGSIGTPSLLVMPI